MDTISHPTPTSAQPSTPGRKRRNYLIWGGAAVVALAVGITAAVVFTNRDTPVVDAGPARVDVATIAGIGEVLVDGQGRTLYLFEPDEGADVTCTGGCADKWPPLVAVEGAEPEVGRDVDPALVATVADQVGAEVLTFEGWPLYRYVSDEVGEASGTGKDQNGGVWWALTPAGERVEAP